MLNHIDVMGRLTRDPELRYTQTQVPVATFTLAVDQDYAQQGQERKADFIPVVVWRGAAEFVSKYFKKGSMAVASGRLHIREYTDRDGNKRNVAEIVADNVYFGEKKKEEPEGDSPFPPGVTGRVDKSKLQELPETDGDLPF